MATHEFKIACTIGKKLNETPSGSGIFSGVRIAPTNSQTATVNTQTRIRSLLPREMFGSALGGWVEFMIRVYLFRL